MFSRAVIFLFGFACIAIICSQRQVATPLRNEKHERVVMKTGVDSKKIDVVYLWVNGTSHTLPKTKLQEAATPNRFREWAELYYSIELLKENTRNLGRIFVVTNGNRPRYDNMDDIIFLDHKDFIPSKYLPTFSSYTIQFNLDGVFKHVSDPFILLDDDFFITQPLDFKEFVSNKVWYV